MRADKDSGIDCGWEEWRRKWRYTAPSNATECISMYRFRPSLALLAACMLACTACATTTSGAASPTVTLRGHVFGIELAVTPAEHARGLMDRKAMPAGHGMLFVFPDSQPRTFWMKDTLIPLDILFFDDAHRLVAMRADAQPCRADPCSLYPSEVPARYVLELNAGTAAKLGLRNGDVMTISGESSGTQ